MRAWKQLICLLCVEVIITLAFSAECNAQWVGIAQSGDWTTRAYVKPSLKQLLDDNQRDFDQSGLRLTYASPFIENGQQHWVGIARAGDWVHRVYVRASLKQLMDDNQRDFDQSGLRMIHAVPFVEGGQQHWLGIARSGDWATRTYVRASLKQLLDDNQRDFDQSGLRLTYATPFAEGDQQHWFGIARAGDWAIRTYVRASLKQLMDDNQRDFDQSGLRLIHAIPFVEGGQQHWLGIARTGDWAARAYVRNSLKQLMDDNQRDFDQAGFRLTSIQPPR